MRFLILIAFVAAIWYAFSFQNKPVENDKYFNRYRAIIAIQYGVLTHQGGQPTQPQDVRNEEK